MNVFKSVFSTINGASQAFLTLQPRFEHDLKRQTLFWTQLLNDGISSGSGEQSQEAKALLSSSLLSPVYLKCSLQTSLLQVDQLLTVHRCDAFTRLESYGSSQPSVKMCLQQTAVFSLSFPLMFKTLNYSNKKRDGEANI